MQNNYGVDLKTGGANCGNLAPQKDTISALTGSRRAMREKRNNMCKREESHFCPCQPGDRAHPRPAFCMSGGLAGRPRVRGAGSFWVDGSRPRSVATAGMPPRKWMSELRCGVVAGIMAPRS